MGRGIDNCVLVGLVCRGCVYLFLLQKKNEKEENEKEQNDATNVRTTIQWTISGGLSKSIKLLILF